MKKLLCGIPFLAAASIAFFAAPRAHAQLVTFETLSAYNSGDAIQGFGGANSPALIETFTNILQIDSITFRFTLTGADTVDQNFSAYLVQWNNTTNKAQTTFAAPTNPNATLNVDGSNPTDASTSIPLTTFTVASTANSGNSYGSWATDTFNGGGNYQGYDVKLNLAQATDPSLTYAIVLIDTTAGTGSSGLGLLDINDADPFIYGQALKTSSGTSLSAVQTLTANTSPNGGVGGDYGFSQIVVVPKGNVVPTPEPRTAAAILCALFVAGLVGRQLLLRRREDAASFSALAA